MTTQSRTQLPSVVSQAEWLAASKKLLAKEKKATRERDHGRGVEALGSVWTLLDLTPYGRQETWEDSPEGWPRTAPYEWWRRHDEYGDQA